MAWNPNGKNKKLGIDEYSGDASWDAFGRALSTIAEACSAKIGRLPTTVELAHALTLAFDAAPAGDILDPDAAKARLARWARPRATPKRTLAVGDLFAIPYAGDGAQKIYGWVIHAPNKSLSSPARPWMVVLDRDVGVEDDLSEVIRAPVLVGPVVLITELGDGEWEVAGHAEGDVDALLPCFAETVVRNGKTVSIIVDCFENEVPETPENRARIRSPYVGTVCVIPAVRALRGKGRWLDFFDEVLPPGRKRPERRP